MLTLLNLYFVMHKKDGKTNFTLRYLLFLKTCQNHTTPYSTIFKNDQILCLIKIE